MAPCISFLKSILSQHSLWPDRTDADKEKEKMDRDLFQVMGAVDGSGRFWNTHVVGVGSEES